MPYIDKEQKAEKEVRLKALAKEYGIKATVARKNYDTIVLNISGGKIDFFGSYNEVDTHYSSSYIQVNEYYIEKHFTGIAQEFLMKAHAIMNEGNFNDSDAMIDYFHRGWYVRINIGQWNKPYRFALAA
jgi:predicted methyltransferase MtxX (methanogen marker protein 4)